MFSRHQRKAISASDSIRYRCRTAEKRRSKVQEWLSITSPLKATLSGKNTGKKILSRTLSGVGTIATYVVGGGGAGLNRTITGETLLRDRVAGNIALVGEQELMNAAYAQNISVTVPANTRFYVVLQKAAVNTTTAAPPQIAERSALSFGMPTT